MEPSSQRKRGARTFAIFLGGCITLFALTALFASGAVGTVGPLVPIGAFVVLCTGMQLLIIRRS